MTARTTWSMIALMLLSATFAGCGIEGPEGREQIQPAVQPFLNAPGSRNDNDRNRLPSEFLVHQIDEAKNTLDVCIYGFSKQNIIDAVIRAYDRGVEVRVAGDARHLQYRAHGYEALVDRQIPMQVGNQFHIMHNKFFIIDDRFVWVGTGNITSTGFGRNNNNWVYIDSEPVAADFKAEFDQMFEGRFSKAKHRIDNGERYQVGDTDVEVYFSPQEDAMGVIREELDKVHTSIHFQIFAFTKDEVGSDFIKKHDRFMRENAEIDPNFRDKPVTEWPKKVVGLLDRSQVHGNGQYHEGYRLAARGVPMRLDANENSRLPGDYQAGGGRLHTKTMILDYGTPDARVVTGSFNWSSAATISNDEVLLVLRGERVVESFMDGFREMWSLSRTLDGGWCYYMEPDENGERPTCSKEAGPGSVVISEVHWDGWNGEPDPSDHTDTVRDEVSNDEFIELYNPTDRPINMSMWTITGGDDFKLGFTPGTVIEPGEYFLVLDHNVVPYSEGDPQRGNHAFLNPDFVLNMANDPRFPRLNLKNLGFYLDLRDATGEVIDEAGDHGPPFWGGRKTVGDGVVNYSMERKIGADGSAGDGTKAGSWKASSVDRGGQNVHPDYRDFIMATPGEPNSP
ncbi:phospholipase D-like domain-containing protein [Persicimonas caeni]|nr:phospholipase D-like domain-containing protein [Persicimonas caeni]